VAVHLISLCATLERGLPAEKSIDLIRRAVGHPDLWTWLAPHTPIGSLTVADVIAAPTPRERASIARMWAEDVWLAYSDHHSTVRRWLDQI
jgi:hypothetical protein